MAGALVAELREVSVDYRVGDAIVPALVEASLSFHAGSSTALLGRSGSGKSTLVSVLALLRRPTRGAVSIDGRLIGGLRDGDLAALRHQCVGTVFQSYHLDPSLSAAENVMLPWYFGGAGRRQSAIGRARELLDLVGIGDLARRKPGEMSGGQRQRVAIARALFCEPVLLVADEPTGNLDEETASSVADLLFGLPQHTQTAAVVVTHDDQIAKRADVTVRISQGRLVTVAANPAAGG